MSSAEKLYVTDGRSGNKYEVPINLNAVLASDLANIHDPCSQTPRSLRIVDESLRHTAIGYSHITLLDAEKGRLYYRDHDITSIFGKKTYEQSCFCLIWGRWPSSAEAVAFRQDLAASVEHFPQLVLDIIRKLP